MNRYKLISIMKYIACVLMFLVSVVGCKNPDETTVIKNDELIVVDTIIIDYGLVNDRVESRNSVLRNKSVYDLIDTLKSLQEIPNLKQVNEDGLPFSHQTNALYYSYNIPRSIYVMIFPEEEVGLDKVRYTNSILSHNDSTVTIQKGVKITESRKYKTLLSVVEKEKYLQLLLTKQGKYSPEIDLITVSKIDLSNIDVVNLYGGIYDSYDIDYWHSVLNDAYDKVTVTKIKNTLFNDIKLDTSSLEYTFSAVGKVVEI